jgi:hypothetical protein
MMAFLKLKYSPNENDVFQICTIMGDFYSIYDTYDKLIRIMPKETIEVSDIGSGIKLDMDKPKPYNASICERLNSVERW